MKTYLESLEKLHDYVLEDIVKEDLKMRVQDDKKDDDILEGMLKKTKFGMKEVSKKEYIKERQVEKKRLAKVLRTIEILLKEQEVWKTKIEKPLKKEDRSQD